MPFTPDPDEPLPVLREFKAAAHKECPFCNSTKITRTPGRPQFDENGYHTPVVNTCSNGHTFNTLVDHSPVKPLVSGEGAIKPAKRAFE